MRLTSVILTTAVVIMPAQAFACANYQQTAACQPHHHATRSLPVTPNSMAVSREAGVMVYRGSSSRPDFVALNAAKAQREAVQARAKEQRRQQQAQTRRIDERLKEIEDKLDNIQLSESAAPSGRRRSFRGNPRFFGQNGFTGNSNFSGATVSLRGRGRGRGSIR